jgi:hypothetical protein
MFRVFLVLAMIFSLNLQAQVGGNPFANYSFESSGYDSSGNGLHGSFVGTAKTIYDAERNSQVLVLDGRRDAVDLGNSPLFDWRGAMTIAFWVKLEAWQDKWDTILKKENAWSFERHIDQPAMAFYHWPHFMPSLAELAAGMPWCHIAVTYDGKVQKIYVNGLLHNSMSNPGSITLNQNHVFIGAANGSERFFKGRMDELRFYDRIVSDAEIEKMAGSTASPKIEMYSALQFITGNFELNSEFSLPANSAPVRFIFSGYADTSAYAFLEISRFSIVLGRNLGGRTDIWKSYANTGDSWRVRILKKGNFYRFWINDKTAWIRGPLGEWQGIFEPWQAWTGVMSADSTILPEYGLTSLPWLPPPDHPLIPRGPAGSYYEEQIIPGAILEWDHQYYLYFMAGMKGNEEGASNRSVGVATSSDLRNWTVMPEALLTEADFGLGDNLYPGAAVVTPDGKIALVSSVQKYPDWLGFFLAVADHPLGPFRNYTGNPVYKHITHAHEFDLIKTDEPGRRYILFYAGYTPNPPAGPAGDRGYAVYSDDLVNWQADAANPIFGPETLNNWDAVHIRPRSLTKIGGHYYLWYEGVNNWSPPGSTYNPWWDTIGLARSADLYQWDYYPNNPALPAVGIGADQFDSNWVGWPRMIIRKDTCYIFYTGNGEVGLRTMSVVQLTDWDRETFSPDKPSSYPQSPEDVILYQNYPNPFNAGTTFSFYLKQGAEIKLAVFDLQGRLIFNRNQVFAGPGAHRIDWDGSDSDGRPVASGLLFYELRTSASRSVGKMMVIR